MVIIMEFISHRILGRITLGNGESRLAWWAGTNSTWVYKCFLNHTTWLRGSFPSQCTVSGINSLTNTSKCLLCAKPFAESYKVIANGRKIPSTSSRLPF